MKEATGLFSQLGWYATYCFRTAILTSNQQGLLFEERVYKRKVKLIFLGEVDNSFRFQLLTIHYDFEGAPVQGFIKKISYVFDKIVISTTKDGTIQKIENIHEIKKHWILTCNELSKDHKGSAVNAYFTSINNLLENEKDFIDFVTEPKMFGMLFNNIYKTGASEIFGGCSIFCDSKNTGGTTVRIKDNEGNAAGMFRLTPGYLEEGILKAGNIKYEILWLGKKMMI